MRPEERDPARLWDMIEAARAIVDFTKNLTLKEFLSAGRDRAINGESLTNRRSHPYPRRLVRACSSAPHPDFHLHP
jgi:hypothetical protein